ncbi:hypothetical protein FRC07_000070 [Ceratobasidium sp. 392]|nr:hypothetical protein FRC07_000070 [Ceratobasidium sp. 392]
MSSENSTVLGVVVLTRHGDRQGFFQSPDTYAATETEITPLGLSQEYQLGQLLRNLYFTPSSPSLISGISTGLFDQNQVRIRADAGGEGGVIFNSAVALAQGLWPAEAGFNTTLANAAFYNSTEFKQVANESADFLASLRPLVGPERPLKLTNMWNIFDFLNVQSIHARNLSVQITPSTLGQARALANWHQYMTFSSPRMDGVGNIAGRTVLPDILTSLDAFADASQPLRFTYLSLSYKPFISLFNMTGVAQANPQLAGIVDYASAITFELRQSSSRSAPVVRMSFKNGSDEAAFTTYSMFGAEGDTPLKVFMSRLSPSQINDLTTWCAACDNWTDRKCNLVAAASATPPHHSAASAVGAGFIGAGVTIAIFLAALGVLAFMGLIVFGRKHKRMGSAPILPILQRGSSTVSHAYHSPSA